MQDHGGAAAEAAIAGFERSFYAEILVDWNGDGQFSHVLSTLDNYVEEVSVDRAVNGTGPENIMLVEGNAAAELTFKIGGDHDGVPLTAVFSPYNTRSILANKIKLGAEVIYRIVVDTEEGPVKYQQFIGKIRTITPDRNANAVTITALDRSEVLRKPVRLAPWAVSDEHMNYGETNSQLCYSHWVIDNCLRLCDVSPGPKRPTFREEQGVPDDGLDGVQLYVTGNGSYLPTIGYLDNPNADSFPKNTTPMYRYQAQMHPDLNPAVWGRPMGLAGLGLPIQQRYSQPADQGIIRYWSADQDNINPRAAHFMGFTLNTNGTNATAFQTIGLHVVLQVFIGYARSIEVLIQNGQVFSRRVNHANNNSYDETPRINIPTGQTNVDVFVQWDNTSQSGSRAYVRAGSNSTSGMVTVGSPVTFAENLGADQIKGRVSIGQALNLSDIFYSVRNFYGTGGNLTDEAWRPAKYAAYVDTGKNRFTHMPSDDTRDAWTTIKDVAAAEFGAVFWDEFGFFNFWNSDTINDNRSNTVRTLSLDDVSGLSITDNIDSIKNVFTVKTAKRRALMTGGIYESQDVNEFYVPARTEKTFRIFADDIMSPLTFRMSKFMSKAEYNNGTNNFPVWGDQVKHGYCVQYHDIGSTGLWRELHDRAGVDVRVYFTTGGMLTVRIWNGWEEPIRLAGGSATDDPLPMFRLAGTLIQDGATKSVITRDRPSITKYGDQNITLEGSWYQDTYGAHDMIADVIANSREPKPTTDAITIAGDPRLQLFDVLAIDDPGGIGEGLRMQIVGISRLLSRDNGLEDTLTVELLNPEAPAAPTPPGAPQNLTYEYTGQDDVRLDWSDVPNATYYRIYDEINAPDGLAQNGTVFASFAELSNLPNGTYRFKVTAVTMYGESDDSATVQFNIPFDPPVTAPTVNVGADSSGTAGQSFSRTATITGTATSVVWTIVGPGTVIDNDANLSWTPSTAGTYTLRCTVSNSGGSNYDDLVLTVAAASSNYSLGKTTAGSQSSSSSTDKIAVSRHTATDSGKLVTGHGHIWLSAAGSSSVRMVVYADASGEPGAVLALSDATTVTNTTDTVQHFTFSGSAQVSIASGTAYWIGFYWQDPGTPSVVFGREGDASGRREQSGTGTVYPTPPNPFGTGTVQTGPVAAWIEYEPVAAGGTAPVVRSFSVGTEAAGSNTVNVAKPSGLQADDYLIALHVGDADNTISGPFPTLSTAAADAANNIPPAKVYGRIATSTDASATSFTFTSTGSSGGASIVLIAIQKGTFSAANPVTVGTWTRQARTSNRAQTAPSITGVVNGLLLGMFGTEANGVAQTYSGSSGNPSGMALIGQQNSSDSYALAGVYSQTLSAAGATGTRVATPTGTSTTNGWSASLVMINPA